MKLSKLKATSHSALYKKMEMLINNYKAFTASSGFTKSTDKQELKCIGMSETYHILQDRDITNKTPNYKNHNINIVYVHCSNCSSSSTHVMYILKCLCVLV